MKFETDHLPYKKILWDKGYTEDQEYELITYQIVTLECGHKVKIKKLGYKLLEVPCPICD